MTTTNNQTNPVTGNSGGKVLKNEHQKGSGKAAAQPTKFLKKAEEVNNEQPDEFGADMKKGKSFQPPGDIGKAEKQKKVEEDKGEDENQQDDQPDENQGVEDEATQGTTLRRVQVGALGKLMMQTVSASGNSQKALAVVKKVEEAFNANNQVLIDLCLLPPNMWNLIGKTVDQTNALTQTVLSKKNASNKNASRLYNQEIERVNNLKKSIKIPTTSSDYLTIGNLLKNSPVLKGGYDELRQYVLSIGIPAGNDSYNLSLYHCQNLWKGFTFEQFKEANMLRYRAILIGTHIDWQDKQDVYSLDELVIPEAPEDFLQYDPRAWMTWINPRFATKCVDARINGVPNAKILDWVFSIEASMAKAMGVQVDMSSKRIDKYESNTITNWWEKISQAYKILNKNILKSKGVKDVGIQSTKWSEVSLSDPNDNIFDT